jgi:cytochrome c-type biogenesis protein
MVQDIPITIAFLAGILSFLSPCVLPIVPGFISYIVGKSFADLQNSSGLKTLKLFPYVLLFTLGFSFVFIIMGASIDFLSDIFFDFKRQLNFISGILIITLGLYFIGIIKIPFLDFERKLKLQGFQNNHFFPFLIGVAFAFGWSPCIGPILGSVLAVAIKDSVNGVILLSFYSMGLAVPFIIVGLMMSKLLIMTSFLNRYIRYFQFITGIILLITGVLIFNGSIQSLGFQLNSILPSLEMLLI